MSRKKILSYALIAIVILGIFFGFFNSRVAYAQREAPAGSAYSGTMVKGVAQWYATKDSGGWLAELFADVLFWIVWTPSSWVMDLGAYLLDKSMLLTVTDGFRSLATSSVVTTGWEFSRDIVNMFLIFILLYIAIATILRLSGYGAKELLTTLIIVAFLVNFSGVVTRMIIDASNVLANGFYSQILRRNETISTTFKNAFNAEKILSPGNAQTALLELKGDRKLIAILSSSIIMLVAAFVFGALGILFLIRVVVLLILIMFSPLAFGAMVLPSTKRHASKWWSSLFSQAFFAPAAMMMLLISANIANSSFMRTFTGVTNETIIEATVNAAKNGSSSLWRYLVQFSIVVIMLVASLVVSKQMGAIGANTAIAAGRNIKRRAQGYAGSVAARNTVGRLARAAAESKAGQALGRVPVVGGMAYRGMEKAAQVGRLEEISRRAAETKAKVGLNLAPQQQAAYFKGLNARAQDAMLAKLNPKQQAEMRKAQPDVFDTMFKRLEARMGKVTVDNMRAKIGNSMETEKERGDYFKTLSPEAQQEMFKMASGRDRVDLLKATKTGDAAKDDALRTALMNILTKEEEDKTKKVEKEVERHGKVENLEKTNAEEFDKNIVLIKPEEIKDLSADIVNPSKDLYAKEKTESLLKLSSAHALKILDRGDELTDKYIETLANLGKKFGNSMKNLADELQKRGNFTMAAQVRGNAVMKAHLEERGLTDDTKKKKKP